jgi:hypothetical protein
MKALELRLGRIPQMLQWNELHRTVRGILISKGTNSEKSLDQVDHFDLQLGSALLNADLTTIKKLEKLPDLLDRSDFFLSSAALLYTLGDEDNVPEYITDQIPKEEVADFMDTWGKKYLTSFFPNGINISEDTTKLTSKILGCKVMVSSPNKDPFVQVAESILASTEGFLSTTILRKAIGKEELIEINIVSSDEIKDFIEFSFENNGSNPVFTVKCKDFNPHSLSKEDQTKLSKAMYELTVQLIAHIVMFKDPKKELEEIMKDEKAGERSMNFTNSFVVMGNVLGHKPIFDLSEMCKDEKLYTLKRTEPLLFKHEENQDEVNELNPHELKHSEMDVVSIINAELWDQAKWSATFYLFAEDMPPMLCIGFTDKISAEKIFKSWQTRFGKKDTKEEINVSILKGINAKNPLYYKVSISSTITPQKGKYIAFTSRTNTMTPASSTNLDMFTKAYNKFGTYTLAPAIIKDGKVEICQDLGIVKSKINIKNAWEIKETDTHLLGALRPTDNPVIPAGVKDPPVLNILKRMSKLK